MSAPDLHPGAHEVEPHHRRALVVDDERLVRWSLRETLIDHGFSVVEADDGRSAVNALADGAEPPEVVLLDLRLPDSRDLSLLSRIISLVPRSKVILMTSYGTPEVHRAALERGAFTVLHKPFELQEVAAIVG